MLFNTLAIAAAALAGSAFAAPVANATVDPEAFLLNAPLPVTLGPFLALLDVISTVPDSVLNAGDAAANAWLNPAGAQAVQAINAAPSAALAARDVQNTDAAATSEAVDSVIGDVECAAAVAAAIAGDLLPAAKLLKVKSLIKVLGGVKKVAHLILEFHKDKNQAIKDGGQDLLDLVEIVLGIDSIKKHCS